MCSCRQMKCASRAGSDSRSDHVEANPRLIMAVVAVGVIVGALFSPARPPQPTVATIQPQPAAADLSR